MTVLGDRDVDDAAEVRWDLDPLVSDLGGWEGALDAADAKATAVEERRGTVAGLDAAALRSLVDDLAELRELVDRAMSYVSLNLSTDVNDPARGRAYAAAGERATALSNRIVFFELEWAKVDDASVEALLADDRLAPHRHHLRAIRRYRDHLLPEPEEKLLAEKARTGEQAWVRLFGELTSTIEVTIDGTTTTLEGGLARLQDPSSEVRAKAAVAVTEALAPGLRTRAFIFNTLLADKATDDRLRRYDTWVSSMNLYNEASDASVDALVDRVVNRYDIPQRWYALKAKILGVERLSDWDRNAAVVDADQRFSFNDAKTLVLDAYASFSPDLAAAGARFFDEGWIDAPALPGKRNGAFCSYTVPSHHPYLFLNWTYRRNDVLTLAHELGHGLHAYMARPQGVFQQSTGLTLAETASVFGETVTFGQLLEATTDPNQRLALLAESIEGAIATVFRQTAMNRFEHAVHTARRGEGELSVERFGELWAQTQTDMFGSTVEVTEGYKTWWSYIPHFMGSPGYVYAYAFGQLLALSVYKQYTEQGSDFVPRYLHLLSSGGSAPPEDLAMIVGCNLTDPGFWDGGLAIVEAQLEAAEAAAFEAGRLH
jgi:oligoendopeptidase F